MDSEVAGIIEEAKKKVRELRATDGKVAEVLDRILDVLQDLAEGQEGIMRRIGELSKKVDSQGALLREQGRILQRHEQILQEHSRMLKEHSETLANVLRVLGEHTKTLELHTKILEEHTRILGAYAKILEEHTKILRDHTRMLRRLVRDVRDLKTVVGRMSVDLEREAREVLEVLLKRELGLSVRLGHLKLTDVEINIYSEGEVTVIGECKARIGLSAIRDLLSRALTLLRVRPRVKKVILVLYGLEVIPEAKKVAEALGIGIAMPKGFEVVPKFVEAASIRELMEEYRRMFELMGRRR